MTTVPLHRAQLPQLHGVPLLADGGIETTLIYHDGLELPLFRGVHSARARGGQAALLRYFESYVEVARKHGVGLILESHVARQPRLGRALGYSRAARALEPQALEMLVTLRAEHGDISTIVVSGASGRAATATAQPDDEAPSRPRPTTPCRSAPSPRPTPTWSCVTMTYAEEAVGAPAPRAHADAGRDLVHGRDRRSPAHGQSLGEAIAQVDRETAGGPDYYMINCAHPDHFAHALEPGAPWLERIRGVRANASRLSHAELDEATELDAGDPDELAADYLRLTIGSPKLSVIGGCCGTDERHVDAIAGAWLPALSRRRRPMSALTTHGAATRRR